MRIAARVKAGWVWLGLTLVSVTQVFVARVFVAAYLPLRISLGRSGKAKTSIDEGICVARIWSM